MKIGLMGAMVEEVSAFREGMEVHQHTTWSGMDFFEGVLEGMDVVLACSGIGKVNAALGVQVLVDRFGIDGLVFTGIAGAVDPDLDVGDIVVSDDACQHDFDSTAFGYERGLIPRLRKKWFYADRIWVNRFMDASRRLADDLAPSKTIMGRVLSGDQFIADPVMTKKLRKDFSGHCVEMEGAAAAHACYVNQIPFVIIRSISDKADHSAKVDYRAFTQIAVDHSTKLVREVFRHLAVEKEGI